jgi:hypothetical protein
LRPWEFALPEQSGDFDEIVDALLTNHRVQLSYRHNDYKSEEITLTPLTLVILDHQLYSLRGATIAACARFALRV